MAVEIKKEEDAHLVINKAKESIPMLESPIEECSTCKPIKDKNLKAIFKETRGVTNHQEAAS